MSCANSCPHVFETTDIPLKDILGKIRILHCQDCNCAGPNLWICLHRDCLHVGCSEEFSDHNTLHNAANPSHCVHMNVSTHRFWCYACKTEVYMEDKRRCDGTDAELTECVFKSGDSGRSSYNSTLQAGSGPVPENDCVPSIVFPTTAAIGMSGAGGGGDTSESSDTEDGSDGMANRPFGLVGLQNIGNTCYLNAALQALSNTAPLTKFFLDCPTTVMIVSEGRKPGLSRTYQVLMTEIWRKKNGGYVIPSGILYGIRNVHAMFRGYHQHDTQEFLRNLMDQLHEELKQAWTPDPTATDLDSYSTTADGAAAAATAAHGSNYDSSEGEYETCDSGVSERSSLSDDMERIPTAIDSASSSSSSSKRRPSRSSSPNRRLRTRFQNTVVIENQPTTNAATSNTGSSIKLSGGGGTTTTVVTAKSKQIKYKSIISDIFDGKLLSTVQCLTCNRVSSRVETFQDLSLPIPSRDHLAVIHGRNSAAAAAASAAAASPSSCTHNSNGGVVGSTCTEAVLPTDNGWISWILVWIRSWFYGPTITLHDCLAAFFSTDELKGDNMYSCERCNKLRNGIKYSKVLQLPEVLCIHLKRFRHELMFSSKISSTVSFPLKGLEMRPYLHADCVSHVTAYELFSVICHHGTAGGGHYTCYALNSGQWYEFDDQCVTRVSAETVQSCEAYVLFYRKVTTDTVVLKTKVMELSREAAARCGTKDDELFYISRQWLSRFHACAEPGPIDNRDFLCQHGYISPERAKTLEQLAIAVPESVYTFLYKKFGGNAPTSAVICSNCQALHCRLEFEMERLMRLNLASQKLQLPATYLLSKSWYAAWLNYVQRKSADPPGPIDNGKPASYASQWGDEYAEVSEDIWNFFHAIYGGGPELRLNVKAAVDSSDSNCENSDCNVSDAPPQAPVARQDRVTPSAQYEKGDAESRGPDTRGCHGEPMDVDANEMEADASFEKATTEMGEDADVEANRTLYDDDCNRLTSGCGALSGSISNTSIGGIEAQEEEEEEAEVTSQSDKCCRAAVRPPPDNTNARRFYRRRKTRDVYNK